MDVLQQAQVVGRIRDDLAALMGTRMRLKANMGRSKIIEREGVLEQKRERTARVSYSYVDVLTGTVELTHCDSGENLLPWLN